jgi:hypothetical protein
MALHEQASKTVNGVKYQFGIAVSADRITVEILTAENRKQRRLWQAALASMGWTVHDTCAACWQECLERLGLQATPVDTCGMKQAYSLSGLANCMNILLNMMEQHGIFVHVEWREASIPWSAAGSGPEKKVRYPDRIFMTREGGLRQLPRHNVII